MHPRPSCIELQRVCVALQQVFCRWLFVHLLGEAPQPDVQPMIWLYAATEAYRCLACVQGEHCMNLALATPHLQAKLINFQSTMFDCCSCCLLNGEGMSLLFFMSSCRNSMARCSQCCAEGVQGPSRLAFTPR